MKTNLFRKTHSSSKWGMRMMRIALLLLPLLGRGLGGGCVLFAQNGVTVSGLVVDVGTVTFNVSWKNTDMPEVWSDTVWVFVDYNNKGVMERLPLSPGATLTATSPGGKVIEESDNNKGVWVVGNARTQGSFSATVKLLTATANLAGACAYASNYPPVGEYKNNATEILFTGTPMYDIQLAKPGGGSVTVKSGDTFLMPCEYTVTSFTDATGAPGILVGNPGIPGIHQPQGSCTYTEPAVVGTFANFPSDFSSATYVSLVDERDNKIYPVVKIGARWIMTRNLNYQKDLNFNAASNQANGKSFTSATNGTPAIGSFWCPGANVATTSTQAACEIWGALYSWETAMMVDGKWTSSMKSGSSWSEPSSYGTNTGSANTQNHARSDAGAVTGGRGICPPNWHVPTDGEWGVLLNEMETGTKNHNTATGWNGTNAGTRAKSKCTCPSATYCDTDTDVTSWHGGGTEGSDDYGFRMLPAGDRYSGGASFAHRCTSAIFGSSTAIDGGLMWHRRIDYGSGLVQRKDGRRSVGYSVRCIRD